MWSLSSKVLSTSTRKTAVSGVLITRPLSVWSMRSSSRPDRDLVRLVPQPYHRFGEGMFRAELAEARGAQQEVTTGRCFETQPARGKHSQKVGAREYGQVSLQGSHSADDPVGSDAHLIRGFSARATVAEQLPIRALRVDLGGAATFILAIIPFSQIGIDLGHTAEAGEFGGPPRALRRTGQYLGQERSAQPLTESAGLPFAMFC